MSNLRTMLMASRLVAALAAASVAIGTAAADAGSGNLATFRVVGDGIPQALGGVARTFSVAQLRLRVVDNMRVNPTTIMPSYYRVEGLDRVAAAYRGKPILDAGQVEDIVAYLATLK